MVSGQVKVKEQYACISRHATAEMQQHACINSRPSEAADTVALSTSFNVIENDLICSEEAKLMFFAVKKKTIKISHNSLHLFLYLI